MTFLETARALRGGVRPEPALTGPVDAGDLTAYVTTVCDGVVHAVNGTRNDTLNRASFTLGRIVGAGQLDHRATADALTAAGRAAGLDDGEITATVASGLAAGEADPRALSSSVTTVRAHVTVLAMPARPELDTFWDARPSLAHIRTFAQARMCSPWAVLGCALTRVIVATPPFYALPATIGSHASLNLFVALVGPSGTGKGAADAAAADALHVGDVHHSHVGSGEGIAHLYAHREKREIVRDRDAVLFTIPEVDNLTALGSRQGATLLPQLRSAWSGESLGFAYVDPTKNLRIERHTYRLGLLLGVQPGRAAPLLEDADGGTPQRFLWMPTTDPDMPEQPPAEPAPMDWKLPDKPVLTDVSGLTVVTVPEQARQTVIATHRAKLRGENDTLDGHAVLARLKAATALALLEGRTRVDDQDWDLSGTLMAVSDATRAGVTAHLASRVRQSNMAKGEAEADRAVVVAERLDAVQVRRVCRVITRALRKGDGEWMTRRDVARTVAGRDRPAVDDALGALLDAGQVETRTEGDKTLYRPTDGD